MIKLLKTFLSMLNYIYTYMYCDIVHSRKSIVLFYIIDIHFLLIINLYHHLIVIKI